jgi:beta-lactamase superfamily II metal-dependent hydrolase
MLEITVWDVQHGSAAYIKTPNNRHIVVDLGDNGQEFSPLRTLYGRGVRQLDAVVITHPHRDHMDDIFNFRWLAPQSLWTPRHLTEEVIRTGNRTNDADVVTRYLEVRQQYSGALTPANDLTAHMGFGGATFQVFGLQTCDPGNLNNHSLVVVVSCAGLKMMLPGDNESPSWKELLLDPSFLAAVKSMDVLLAPHHGRVNGW